MVLLNLASYKMFFLLFPLVILGCLRYYKNRNPRLLIIFLILVMLAGTFINVSWAYERKAWGLGYIFTNRHIIYLVVLLIPIGVMFLYEVVRHLSEQKIFRKILNKRILFAGITVFLVFIWYNQYVTYQSGTMIYNLNGGLYEI